MKARLLKVGSVSLTERAVRLVGICGKTGCSMGGGGGGIGAGAGSAAGAGAVWNLSSRSSMVLRKQGDIYMEREEG